MSEPFKHRTNSRWLLTGAFLLSLPWLTPNHQIPWVAFHSDALAAVIWAIISAVIIFKLKPEIQLCQITLTILGIFIVICLQYAVGIIYFSGSALLCALYVCGFYLVYVVARQAEAVWPGTLLDLVFMAIAFAALISVGLQLTQWLDLVPDGLTDIWVMNLPPHRPSGNLGQPNQLASLHIWGLIAILWAHHRKKLGLIVLFLAMSWLGLGLVMAQSRSSLVALILLGLIMVSNRRLWQHHDAVTIVLIVCSLLTVTFYTLPLVGEALLFTRPVDIGGRAEGDVRFSAWKMFIDASLTSPWLGFGWNQVLPAQLAVILEHPKAVGRSFAHTHNIFLDLIIWIGWPLGLLLTGSIVCWLLKSFRQVHSLKSLLIVLPVVTIGVHAMFELPLHYAYFLLPTAFFIGTATANRSSHSNTSTNPRSGARHSILAVWLCSCVLLAVVIVDYFKVEEEFYLLRFEGARIGNLTIGKTPKVILLNQLSELVRFARFEAKAGMTANQIYDAEKITSIYPSLSNLFKVAQIKVLNDNPQGAELYLRKACALLGEKGCAQTKSSWAGFRRDNQNRDIIEWPQSVLGN